jgi:hypothetical protein
MTCGLTYYIAEIFIILVHQTLQAIYRLFRSSLICARPSSGRFSDLPPPLMEFFYPFSSLECLGSPTPPTVFRGFDSLDSLYVEILLTSPFTSLVTTLVSLFVRFLKITVRIFCVVSQ